MKIADLAASDTTFLGALAELLMQAGRDRAADAIYAAMEAETTTPTPRLVLRLVHSAS